MSKRIIGTAMILGIGLVYCIRLLTGSSQPPKMNAPAKDLNHS